MNSTRTLTYTLNNNLKIPRLGFGTWTLNGKVAINAVKWALHEGYRLIDTASFYGNETEIGKALKESALPRENLFITTKIWETEQGYNETFKAFERSLTKLQIDYVDLYLIHWPRARRLETWRAMEELYEQGKTKSIGVSNFKKNHLKELLANAEITPVINQVEFTPFLYQKELLDFCIEHKIKIEAYSPLTKAKKFNNPILREISKKYNKTPAQILIRWGLEHNLIEIPRSKNKKHISENINVFDFRLKEEDIKKLDNLNENFRNVNDIIF
jgi:diketogulonate reductase-like aldo/keto reductase